MAKYSHYADIDPDVEAIKPELDKIAKMTLTVPLDQLRAAFSVGSPRFDDLPVDLHVEETKFTARDGTDISARIYRSPSIKPDATLFYVTHGGGWTIGGLNTEENMQRYVAGKCGAVVVTVDYRMGPEHKYPQAALDSFDGLKWCIANASSLGIDPERIIVGGSSSGANLAAVMALKARDEKVTGIIGQVLNIPVTCHPQFFPKDRYEYTSWEQNKDSAPLSAELMLWFWNNYLGGDVKPEEYHSPLLAKSLEGLPPALVQIAGMDPLRDEGIAYAEALEVAGVKTRLEIFSGVPHAFGSLITVKKARKYQSNVVEFVQSLQNAA